MDDGRRPGVQELESLQDLTTPAPNHLGFDGFQASHVPAKILNMRFYPLAYNNYVCTREHLVFYLI